MKGLRLEKYYLSIAKVIQRYLLLMVLGVLLSDCVYAVTSAQATADYLVGSGLSAGTNRLGTMASALAVVIGLILVIWATISALRAWGSDRGDSFDLLTTVVRGGVLTLGIVIVLSVIT